MHLQAPKTVLCIHDLSGLGRCSLSVIVPVLAAMGCQPVALPTAIFSTHTGGLGQPAVQLCQGYGEAALEHYRSLGVSFDCIYTGYLASEEYKQYLPNVVVSTMQGSLDAFEDRMATLLFKIAVELCMMLHVTAATNEIDTDTLSRLRGLCVEEVKRLRGAVRLEDAVKFQSGDE